LGGALAANYWGIVRSTQDIDFLVAIPAVKYQLLAEALKAIRCQLQEPSGQLVEVTASMLYAEAVDKKFIECFRDSLRIELFIPAVPLQGEALRRAIKLPLNGREVPITSAEDMILLKLAFHRAKDLQDVRGILLVQRGKLDFDYIRRWSAQSHDGAVQSELEQLLNEYS
jgi:hypothetical protein